MYRIRVQTLHLSVNRCPIPKPLIHQNRTRAGHVRVYMQLYNNILCAIRTSNGYAANRVPGAFLLKCATHKGIWLRRLKSVIIIRVKTIQYSHNILCTGVDTFAVGTHNTYLVVFKKKKKKSTFWGKLSALLSIDFTI